MKGWSLAGVWSRLSLVSGILPTETKLEARICTRPNRLPSMFTVRSVDMIGTPNERVVQTRLQHALNKDALMDVNSIRVSKNSVTVLLNAKPSSVSDQNLLKSAAHVIIQDELSLLGFKPDSVLVHLARGTDANEIMAQARILPYKALYEAKPVTTFIEEQMTSVHGFMWIATETMIKAALNRAIDSLPWRNDDEMRAMVKPLTARAMKAYSAGLPDPLHLGCVDEILPPPESFLTTMDYTYLVQEVTKYAGTPMKSRLHFYEIIYQIVQTVSIPLELTCLLFDGVFKNVWDDFMLDETDLIDVEPTPSTDDQVVNLVQPV
ncbi:MAG: hypothetical protein CBC65_000275 [Rhodothermaceae bacterium TMED105]|nr:MAG: hypothetical protein CBC65_000275 [Rhodothermaceae bacterium TMED105]